MARRPHEPVRVCLVLNVALVGGPRWCCSRRSATSTPRASGSRSSASARRARWPTTSAPRASSVTVMGRRGWRDLRATARLWQHFRRTRPDLVLVPHFQRAPPGARALVRPARRGAGQRDRRAQHGPARGRRPRAAPLRRRDAEDHERAGAARAQPEPLPRRARGRRPIPVAPRPRVRGAERHPHPGRCPARTTGAPCAASSASATTTSSPYRSRVSPRSRARIGSCGRSRGSRPPTPASRPWSSARDRSTSSLRRARRGARGDRPGRLHWAAPRRAPLLAGADLGVLSLGARGGADVGHRADGRGAPGAWSARSEACPTSSPTARRGSSSSPATSTPSPPASASSPTTTSCAGRSASGPGRAPSATPASRTPHASSLRWTTPPAARRRCPTGPRQFVCGPTQPHAGVHVLSSERARSPGPGARRSPPAGEVVMDGSVPSAERTGAARPPEHHPRRLAHGTGATRSVDDLHSPDGRRSRPEAVNTRIRT